MENRFPNLLRPLTIGGITLKHRMMASPTSQAELGAEAVDLANKGHDVTILEMIDELAANCGYMHKVGLMHEIEASADIHPATGMRCTWIEPGCVYAADKDGRETAYPCDTVVMASGMRSKSAEVEALRPLVREFYVIGDARKAAKIMNATRDA